MSKAAASRGLGSLKGVFCGSGAAGFNTEAICNAAIRLTGKGSPSDVNVLYVGTATYDIPRFMDLQTGQFATAGCSVQQCDIALAKQPSGEVTIEDKFKWASIVVVSGGNTEYALNRWRGLGVDRCMRAAMERGVVLAGGSAGAICWFDGGHSDSMDPTTFRQAMLQSTSGEEMVEGAGDARWNYVRVNCLGFLPGLVCPHHDKTQSNGIPRAEDFNGMMCRHHTERGICIDHWAAIVVDGAHYEIVYPDGKPGSVLQGKDGSVEFDPTGSKGLPGVWLKEAVAVKKNEEEKKAVNEETAPAPAQSVEWQVEMRHVAYSGNLDDLIREPSAEGIIVDTRVEELATLNPSFWE